MLQPSRQQLVAEDLMRFTETTHTLDIVAGEMGGVRVSRTSRTAAASGHGSRRAGVRGAAPGRLPAAAIPAQPGQPATVSLRRPPGLFRDWNACADLHRQHCMSNEITSHCAHG